jgi:hypothetical protein
MFFVIGRWIAARQAAPVLRERERERKACDVPAAAQLF